MSEATDQAAARVRTMEDHDADAIVVIADALGGLGYELNSGLEVAQFMQALADREIARWITPREAVRNTDGFIYTEAHAAVVREMKIQMPDSVLLDRLIDVPVGSRVIAYALAQEPAHTSPLLACPHPEYLPPFGKKVGRKEVVMNYPKQQINPDKNVKEGTPKLDHRIATAEGMYQAEVHRREKVERKLELFSARHTRLPRPSIAQCTCGTIICPDLAILEGRDWLTVRAERVAVPADGRPRLLHAGETE